MQDLIPYPMSPPFQAHELHIHRNPPLTAYYTKIFLGAVVAIDGDWIAHRDADT